MNTLILNRLSFNEIKHFIPLAVLLAGFTIVLNDYILYVFGLAVLVLLFAVFGERFIDVFVIVSLLTLVGDVSSSLRAVVHIIDFSLLGILFLNRYGLEWNKYPKLPKILVYFLLLYYSAMLVSSIMSDYPSAGIVLILRQSAFFIIVYILFALIKDFKDIRTYFIAFIIATFILATSSAVLFVQNGFALLNFDTGDRATIFSLISNPNNVTNFYIISFPIVLSTILLKKKTLDQIISWLLLLFFSLGLFLTMSRTAVLAVIIGILIFLFILRKKYLIKFTFIAVTLLILFIIIDPIRDFISLLFRIESGLTGRDLLWASSFQIIKDNPIFGLGLGAYKYEIFNYFPAMLNTWTGDWVVKLYEMTNGKNISHSIILMFFSDMGVLGLLTVLSLPVIYFKVGIKTLNYFKDSQPWKYYFTVALFTSGTTMFLRGLVDDIGLLSYGIISADLPFWLVFISLIHLYKSKSIN